MIRYVLICSALLLTSCVGQEANSGCDKFGNCAGSNSLGTMWNELTNDIRRTDAAAPDKIGTAPPAHNPFPERSTWKDFENRIGNQVTDDAYKAQGPAAIKSTMTPNRTGGMSGTIDGQPATVYETPLGTKGNIGGTPFTCTTNRVGTTNCY